MANIVSNVLELVGHTPLIELGRYEKDHGLSARLLAKLEAQNPGGSVKDRVGLYMLQEAEKNGVIQKGSVIVEPTSGNTGIGLALAGAVMGYKTIIVMPDSMSLERRLLLAAYGAELVLTPGKDGMAGAVQKAEEIAKATPGAWIAGQFENPDNPKAHYVSTGPEIWEDTDGQVDAFVAGIGTGGTITGIGRYLKEKNPRTYILGVEPSGSPLLTQGRTGAHGLMGIGANFVPKTLDTGVYDEVLTVTEEDAYAAGRELARKEGLLVGITAGAAVHAGAVLAARPEFRGKNIVVLLPDRGERYLSTPMFSGR